MSSLVSQIEKYLKRQLAASTEGYIDVQRNDLASIFMCVPSQINYVLDTRFNQANGYYVESRRGGGGYVRIIKLALHDEEDMAQLLNNTAKKPIPQTTGENLLDRLVEEEFLTAREGHIIKALLDQDNMQLDKESGDLLRSRLLRVLLLNLLREDF